MPKAIENERLNNIEKSIGKDRNLMKKYFPLSESPITFNPF